MTPEFLQDALIEELKLMFIKEKFPTRSEYDTMQNLKIFAQELPQESNREEDTNEPFPYLIVRLVKGNTPDYDSAHEVKIFVIIGMYYTNKDKQGHREVLNIINRIRERFQKNRILANQFVYKTPTYWELQDTDSHPYYFGGVELNFDIPEIRCEDDLT